MAVKAGILGISISPRAMAMVMTTRSRSSSSINVKKRFGCELNSLPGTAEWEAEITVNLSSWVSELGYRSFSAAVAISREMSVVKAVDLPPLSADKLSKLLSVQGSELIGIPNEDMILTVIRSDNSPIGLKQLVSAVRRREAESLVKAVKAAGIGVIRLIAETAAELNTIALFSQGCMEGDTVIAFGKPGNGLEVIASRDGYPLSSVKSTEGKTLWALKTAEETAEDSVGGVFTKRAVYFTAEPSSISEGAVIIELPSGDPGALGAALTACGYGRYSSEYLVEPDSSVSGNRASKRRIVAATAVTAFILAAFTAAMVIENRSLNAKEKAARSELKALGTQAQVVGALEQKRDKLAVLGMKLKNLRERRQPVLRALAEVSKAAPQGVELTGFSYDEAKGLKINAICGGQMLAKELVSALSKSSLFNNVTINSSRWSGDGIDQSVEITVACGLNRVVER